MTLLSLARFYSACELLEARALEGDPEAIATMERFSDEVLHLDLLPAGSRDISGEDLRLAMCEEEIDDLRTSPDLSPEMLVELLDRSCLRVSVESARCAIQYASRTTRPGFGRRVVSYLLSPAASADDRYYRHVRDALQAANPEALAAEIMTAALLRLSSPSLAIGETEEEASLREMREFSEARKTDGESDAFIRKAFCEVVVGFKNGTIAYEQIEPELARKISEEHGRTNVATLKPSLTLVQ